MQKYYSRRVFLITVDISTIYLLKSFKEQIGAQTITIRSFFYSTLT